MVEKFKRFIVIINLLLSLFLTNLLAQESVTIINQDLSQGVTLELNTSTLIPSTNFLVISDSSNHTLALSNLVLNDQNIWIKKSSETVNTTNTVHWYYDENSQFLYIDLTGIKESFSANTVLQLTILPLKTFESYLSFSVFESSSNSGNIPDVLQKVSDFKVDLK